VYGFTTLNTISSIGAFILGSSTLPFIWNAIRSYRYGPVVTVDDPRGYGNSLEWATSCPPPRRNFTELPGSAPSARRSSCTTHTWSSACGPRRTPVGVAGTPPRPR
jgi:heme/copper-type cytochrome/quinol oxidase subunit 1